MKTQKKQLHWMAIFAAALSVAFEAFGANAWMQQARKSPEWFTRGVMYQIQPRAFTPEGTLAAAKAKLPYLKDLGVTIAYLVPVMKMDTDMDQGFWSPRQIRSGFNNPKNQYRIADYFHVDEEYGTDQDLRDFCAEAHRLGMKVVFDLVYLHCGPTAPFLKEHPEFTWWNPDGTVKKGPWRFPKLNFAVPGLRAYFMDNIKSLIRDFGADGFRCDVGDGIPLDFWCDAHDMMDELTGGNAVLLCEGFTVCDQYKGFDADYGWFPGMGAKAVRGGWAGRERQCPVGSRFVNHYENHDIATDARPRREKAWGHDAVDQVLVWMFTLDGVPLLFTGNEIADADERHSMFGKTPMDWSQLARDPGKSRHAFVKRLAALRREHPAFTDVNGSDGLTWLDTTAEDAVTAFVRRNGRETILVVQNWTRKPVKCTVSFSVSKRATASYLAPDETDRDVKGTIAAEPLFARDASYSSDGGFTIGPLGWWVSKVDTPAVAAPARVVRDIPYDPALGADGLGDLYLPDDLRPETPFILVIHGGGWSALHRPSIAGIAEFFQRDLGFAAFNIEYRLASAKNPWPACGDDCVAAAKFVLSDAFRARYGLHHKKIWITGGSAGGHLVLWTLVNLPPESVAGAISISAVGDPALDFHTRHGRYVPLFGKGVTEESLKAMNPIPFIRKGMAPLLCTHADTDQVVPIASHRAFADAYRAAGNRCDFYEYRHDAEPNTGGHCIWRPKSNPHKLLACLEARMEKFVREYEKAPPPPQPELLFAADFDGTAKAGVAGGDPDPIPKSRNLKFVPGLRGQALEMKKGMNTALGYKTEGNLNLLRGAVSFWFKPADGVMPAGEERRFYLCTQKADPRAGSGTLWFWQYGPRLRADQSDDGDSYTLLLRPYLTNEWNHVVFTWDEKKGTSVYLNGRKSARRMSDSSMSGAMKAAAKAPRGRRPGALSFSRRRTFDTFFVGGYGGSAFMDGAMDELRIYSAPLDDDAVRRLFIDGGGCEPEPPPPPDYRAKYANDSPNPFEAPPLAKGGVPGELELVEQVVFDHVPADTNRFVAVGACRIGNLNGTPYLETDEAVHGRFAYRFTLDESTPLYVFEIDYPDDRKRTMDLIVQGCGQTAWDGATGASYALQQGVACGDEYPNTGRILTHRCLYWSGDGGRAGARPSREGDVALAAMTARGGAPAAIAAIRLYKVKGGRLPVAAIREPAANADGWRRTFALYFEDPAIGYDFGIDGTDEERVGPMIDRIAATMKYTGQNLLAYPGSWYGGLMDGEYNPRVHAPAYRKAYYAKFDREGLGFMPTINQNDLILPRDSITRDKIEDGSLHASPYSIFDDGRPNPGGWHGTPPNFNIAHPDVQAALERAVDAFIAEGRAHPSFKGVVLHLTRHSLSWFGDERAGYNDYAVEAFARAKGLTIPVDRNDPMRGKGYADWIRAHAYDAWLDWRCGVVADLYRRLAAKLRAARPDLKLMVNTFLLPDWRHPDFGKENFIPEANRRAGLDVRLLADVPNIIVCQTEIPADYRWFGPMDPSNSKDNGRWREFRATAEPAHRNLYFKRGDYALLDGAAFPWVNQHDRYWESAIGKVTKDQPGKTLPCAWLKECPWRVTTINPSGRSALKHYAVPFRYHDVLGLSKGGFLIGTYGTEDVLVPFIQAFRALPAVVFDDVPCADGNPLVKVRRKVFDGKTYLYAINTGDTPARVTLELPPGAEDLVTRARMAQTVELTLQPYEFRSFAATCREGK